MNDLISRAAAIEYLMTNMGWHDEDGYEVDDADEKREVITDLVNGIPAVDAAPVVHGKWEEVDDIWGDTHYRCSACGCEWFLEDGSPTENGMNYCPRCGARMDAHE
jgi:DNA-directed RNA polymerase subunit RPC12/RpoP